MGIFSENDEKRKQRDRKINKGWRSMTGALLVLVGIAAVIASVGLPEAHRGAVSAISMTVGQALISIGVTAFLFEHFGYVDYTVDRVCDALARDEVLHVLEKDRKKELKGILLEDIYLGRAPALDPQLLVRQLNNDIGRLLEDYYYEENYVTCDISLVTAQDGQEYFRKLIHRFFTVRPIQEGKDCCLDRLYFSRTNPIPDGVFDEENKAIRPVQFTSLYIDDKKLEFGTDYTVSEEELERDSTYPIACQLKLRDENQMRFSSGAVRVSMTYMTHVRTTDPLYSVTVDKPCKEFSCYVNNGIPHYQLHMKSYGFMVYDTTDRKTHFHTRMGEVAHFSSWILPGDGVVAMLTPKLSPAFPTEERPVCPGDEEPAAGAPMAIL